MRHTNIYIILLLLTPLLTFGQTRKAYEKTAAKYLKNSDYFGAMRNYQKAVQRDSTKLSNLIGAADAARKFTAFSIAEEYYELAVMQDTANSSESLFWLGYVENSQGKYDEAENHYRQWMSGRSETDSLFRYAERYLSHTDWAKKNPEFEDKVVIENLGEGINSAASDFGGAKKDDKLYYSSLRYLNEKDRANPKRYYSKLMVAGEGEDGLKLDAPFNKANDKHIGNLVFNTDNTVAYFTICDYTQDGSISCEVYYADVQSDGGFGSAHKLSSEVNAIGASSTHPMVVEEDATTYMYFSSDRIGGKGGMDIWRVPMTDKDNFGPAENMTSINTEWDEITPFYHSASRTLYFSSNGYSGYGSFDVFKSELEDGSWSIPENMKQPINTSYNDTYFKVSKDGKKALLASNRPSSAQIDPETGTCCNDIYEVDIPVNIRLIVNTLNKFSKEILNGAQVQLVNLTDGTIDTVALQQDGSRYFFPLELGKEYQIIGMKDGFKADTVLVSTMNVDAAAVIEKDLLLEPKLELLALTFDKITQTPLPKAGVRLIDLSDGSKEQIVNDESNEFGFALDYGKDYMLIGYRDGFSTDTLLFSTKDLPFESKKLTKKLFLEKEEGIYASLPVYYHNDEPNPRSTKEVATMSYEQSYTRYMKLQNEYRQKYSAGVPSTERQAAMDEVDRFFTEEVTLGYESLKRFAERLQKYMGDKKNVDIVIKGFASPLAPDDYNVSLTKRRIDNVEKFLKEQDGGLLRPYFESGRIKVVVEPYGESKALPGISDSPKDRQASVYNPKAARERRVEILQLKSSPNKTL